VGNYLDEVTTLMRVLLLSLMNADDNHADGSDDDNLRKPHFAGALDLKSIKLAK